ncbi:MAG: DNA-processing protein DprA [Thiohalocapsa sp.]|nr:DNA-processing protein DprA [Thiohalocapsa sp.]
MSGNAPPARTEDWLALCLAPGVGSRTAARLLERFGSVAAVLAADAEALSQAGLSAQSVRGLRAPEEAAIDAALAWAAHDSACILALDDPRYPPQVASIDAPPPLLFVRGDPLLLSDPQLAVVGTRNPTRGGLDTSRAFAAHLAGIGLCIGSGLALGIDAAAHHGALQTGRTIAVLGTGPDRVYPAAHRELARRIAENGALVTEFPPGTGPRPGHFPRRNRLISALALGTLVVEAAPGSGSLITARYAAEQGREVFAIPGSIHNPLARGCHILIRQGAKLVDSADQILEELVPQLARFTMPPAADAPPDGDPPELDADYRQLLDCMGHDPAAPDELIARSGLSAQSVSSMLLLLELQGHVSSHPGGRYSLRGRS